MKYLLLLIALMATLINPLVYGNNKPVDTTKDKEAQSKIKQKFSYLKRSLGYKPRKERARLPVVRHNITNLNLPDSFDWRDYYPNCTSLSEIRDQGACGSCWAFGATEAISDRICIHSKGALNVYISADDVLSCCTNCGSGCLGGDTLHVYDYWKNTGIVSGGLYHSNQGCKPYEIAPCDHTGEGHDLPSCMDVPLASTPVCRKACRKSYQSTYHKDLYFADSVYVLEQDAQQIQAEILKNGPVSAFFEVFTDFGGYTQGVYRHTWGDHEGYHAIRILGWGVENGTPYWLIANSWNSKWGEKGYFKMVRGENHCSIEKEVIGETSDDEEYNKALLLDNINNVSGDIGTDIESSVTMQDKIDQDVEPAQKNKLQCVSSDECIYPLSDEFINAINQKQTLWTAGRNFAKDISMSYFKNLMGFEPPKSEFKVPEIKHEIVESEIPDNFDWRDHYPSCTTLRTIRDQGSCGSCWAFASVEVMSDRTCIHSKGKSNIYVSADDLLSCCFLCGNGCYGGVPLFAYLYWIFIGIVSGGPYNSDRGCRPYEIPPCVFDENLHSNCSGKMSDTPTCNRNCRTGYTNTYKDDLHYGKSVYSVPSDVKQIQTEIMKNGPVTAAYSVFEDFVHYKKGVYKYTRGKFLGRHAVKILGWGVENSTPYWLIANSWNADWGDEGYFKMLRGENHCEIEDWLVAGSPNQN
ncbi:hypothetical protein ILUMI_13878 [Ignelater luminosus]|uniref:Peptidase C1A papain C-terminal domain-containing protein n=1 Tax=Ignelater luminosus TaxID=2038154 RepID=A0A8K0CVC3_IGNLU|nr:hypothetical protein ILUMI_13878 [Ignelater luminosus]